MEKSNHTAIDAAKKLLYEGMPLLRPNDASPKEVEYSDRVVVWSKCCELVESAAGRLSDAISDSVSLVLMEESCE